MTNIGIYEIINIKNGKRYIGSSNNIKKRFRQHILLLKNNNHYNSYLQNAFNKYGESNFGFNVIEDIIEESNLLNREQYWLDNYKCYNRQNGYNISKIAGKPHIEKGNIPWNKGKVGLQKCTDKNRQRMSKLMKGNTFGSRLKGIKHSEEHKIKIGIGNSKPVINISTGEIFTSLKEASIKYNLHVSNINKVCNGLRNSTGGFIWSYYEV